tara:strand:+ start:928 stop:1323 length:396 start_codon:yes stop_codon:yes gene_type:complete
MWWLLLTAAAQPPYRLPRYLLPRRHTDVEAARLLTDEGMVLVAQILMMGEVRPHACSLRKLARCSRQSMPNAPCPMRANTTPMHTLVCPCMPMHADTFRCMFSPQCGAMIGSYASNVAVLVHDLMFAERAR